MSDSENRMDSDEADYLNALEFVRGLDPKMRACRGSRSHNFLEGEQLFGDVNDGITHTETMCARGCQVIKVEDYDVIRGYYIKDPHYKYPRGYLIDPEEMGTINSTDLAAAMRLIHHYERRGIPLPNVVLMPRKKKRTA